MRGMGLFLGMGALCLLACSTEVDDSTASTTGGTGGSGGATAATGSGGSTTSGGAPDPQYVPAPTGACPDFTAGDVTFAPAGIAPRKVRIWVGDNPQSQDGPLIFYWHGAGSQPAEANVGIGPAISDVQAQGGIVAAPHHDPAAGQFPWFLTTGGGAEDDLVLADEILGCAIEKVGIDLRRIHSAGMSAGALQTVQFSYRRSGYLASVVPYSGGRLGSPPQQETANKFPAMIFHGGSSDQVIVNFETLSISYHGDLIEKGHFAYLCNHGLGHKIAPEAPAAAWQFFQDHPYGTAPSPYAGGLPASMPSFCSL